MRWMGYDCGGGRDCRFCRFGQRPAVRLCRVQRKYALRTCQSLGNGRRAVLLAAGLYACSRLLRMLAPLLRQRLGRLLRAPRRVESFWARVGVPKPRRCRPAAQPVPAATRAPNAMTRIQPVPNPIRPGLRSCAADTGDPVRPSVPVCRHGEEKKSAGNRRSRCGNGDSRQYGATPLTVAVLTIFSILPIVRTITPVESLF